MKSLLLVALLNVLASLALCQAQYSKWFSEGSLRVDYILAGNHDNSEIYLQTLKKEAFWGGSRSNLTDNNGFGEYLCKVFTADSHELIYSQGFSTLFQEWQTTTEATLISKGFFQSTNIPFPNIPVRFEIYERDDKAEFSLKFSVRIDPSDYFIQPSPELDYMVEKLKNSGDPGKCVDIVFLPEGYTLEQMGKFKEDVLRLTDSLFAIEPFSRYKDKFNLYAVLAPSSESGVDIPGENIWKNTQLNSNFYTFDSERYLTTSDFWGVRDLAALAPYDQIYILANSPKYGGGGIYNHYSLTTVDNELSPHVFVHEFGHGFAGLGDEYYTSDVAYSDFYSTKTEPWEPNLTTLVNFQSKWELMLKPGTPVPTPPTPEFINSIGVFEGGGYVAKGVYRPAYNCRMKSNTTDRFCDVCEKAIEKMILQLTQ